VAAVWGRGGGGGTDQKTRVNSAPSVRRPICRTELIITEHKNQLLETDIVPGRIRRRCRPGKRQRVDRSGARLEAILTGASTRCRRVDSTRRADAVAPYLTPYRRLPSADGTATQRRPTNEGRLDRNLYPYSAVPRLTVRRRDYASTTADLFPASPHPTPPQHAYRRTFPYVRLQSARPRIPAPNVTPFARLIGSGSSKSGSCCRCIGSKRHVILSRSASHLLRLYDRLALQSSTRRIPRRAARAFATF